MARSLLGLRALAICSALMIGHTATATSQERQLTVMIEHIAGTNLYLNAGLEAGIEEHDTLAVRRPDGTTVGAFVVVTSSAKRSVVTFAGRPFAITRGDVLEISWIQGHAAQAIAAPDPRPDTNRRSVPRSAGPIASGRLSFEVNSLQSTTVGLGSSPITVDRTFVTPASRFRLNISDLPGHLRLQTSGRVTSRHASTAETVQSAHIYQASLSGSYPAAQFQIGRFYSPYEEFSGFWDGALVRFGPRRLGIGVVAGFEPMRSNETFDSDVRKYSVFVNYQQGAYATDVSVHSVRPSSTGEARTFLGWSQDLGLGPVRVGQRLQVDRDPTSERWTVTDLQFRAALSLGRAGQLHAHYSRRRPYLTWEGQSTLSYQREQVGGGLSVIGRIAQLHLNATANRVEDGNFGWAYSASAAFTPPGSFGVGVSGQARYWKQGTLSGLHLSPSLNRSFGRLRTQGSYHYYRTDHLTGAFLTHGGDVSFSMPLTARWQTAFRASFQRSHNLSNLALYTSLGMSF